MKKSAVFHESELVKAYVRHERCPECLVDIIHGEPVCEGTKCLTCNVWFLPVDCGDNCKDCLSVN